MLTSNVHMIAAVSYSQLKWCVIGWMVQCTCVHPFHVYIMCIGILFLIIFGMRENKHVHVFVGWSLPPCILFLPSFNCKCIYTCRHMFDYPFIKSSPSMIMHTCRSPFQLEPSNLLFPVPTRSRQRHRQPWQPYKA